MNDIDKVFDGLYRLRSHLKVMCAGITEEYYENSMQSVNHAIQTIRELQEQIPKLHYVADGDLPTKNEEVLFIDYDGDIYIGGLHGSDGSRQVWYANYLDDRVKCVIAWMELPMFESEE